MSVGRCACGKEKFNLHNKSLSVIPMMCEKCKQESILRLGLKPAPRGPSRPFSDDNPRSRYVQKLSVSMLTGMLTKRQASR